MSAVDDFSDIAARLKHLEQEKTATRAPAQSITIEINGHTLAEAVNDLLEESWNPVSSMHRGGCCGLTIGFSALKEKE